MDRRVIYYNDTTVPTVDGAEDSVPWLDQIESPQVGLMEELGHQY